MRLAEHLDLDCERECRKCSARGIVDTKGNVEYILLGLGKEKK